MIDKGKSFFVLIFFVLVMKDGHSESLYDAAKYQSLVSDNIAFKVGDTVTVVIVESAKAESRAGTGSEKNTSINAQVNDSVSSHKAGLGIGAATSGDAVTSRVGFLSAKLTVRVIEVTDSNLLKVQGEQSIIINGEEQKIMVSGAIRRQDIDNNNTILSNRLTEAKIEFAGEGVVSDAQKSNVFYQLFEWLGVI